MMDSLNSSGEIQQTGASECHELGGSYFSGVACDSLECGGACCFTAGDDDSLFCEEITRDICENTLLGSFQGYGSECSGEPCCDVFEGACCFENACYEVTEEVCSNLGAKAIFNGISSSCEDGSCATEACCLADGNCENVLSTTCQDLGGTVSGGGCSENSCSGEVPDSFDIGACCITDLQICETVRSSTCDDLSGAFMGTDTTCYDSNCPAVFEGACCLASEGCVTVPQSVCTIIGGTYQGDATSCCEGVCESGACCLATGECEQAQVNICNDLNGNYLGATILCIDDPCADILEGACCLENNFCITVTQEACLDKTGIYQGDGTSCGNAPCTVGACCLSDGLCEQMTLAMCDQLVGSYEGDGVACVDSSCVAPFSIGRCCLDTDECADLSRNRCDSLAGIWDGTTSCALDQCAPNLEGACCISLESCVNIPETACVNLGGLYQGDGSSCNLGPCAVGSCCLITFECTELTSFNCLEVGGEYSGDGTLCADGLCCCVGGSSVPGRPDGACCLGIGECVEITEISCTLLLGAYQGDETLCSSTICEIGACCLPSSSCMEVTETFCTTNGGEFTAGTLCNDCDLDCAVDIGACCLPTGQCKIVTEDTCNGLDGLYMGPGSDCNSTDCGLGACCVSSGSCLMVIDADACEFISGSYQGDGSLCGTTTCDPHYLVTPDRNECPQETVGVVQLANPFAHPVDLTDFTVEFFGQRFSLSSLPSNQRTLYPTTPENPSTLILYAISEVENLDIPLEENPPPVPNNQFIADWLDFLDLDSSDHPIGDEGTIIHPVPSSSWSTKREYYDDLEDDQKHAVAIYRSDDDQLVLVDRLDRPDEMNKFYNRIVEDMELEWSKVDKTDDADDGFIDTEIPVDDPSNPHDVLFVQWDRATRAWGVDIPDLGGWHNGTYDSWERNPRYVFSSRDYIRSLEQLDVINNAEQEPLIDHVSVFSWKWEGADPEDPDDMTRTEVPDTPIDDDALPDIDPDPWFSVETWSPRADSNLTDDGIVAGGLRNRKPTYFDMNRADGGFPDKGWYGQSRVSIDTSDQSNRLVNQAPLGVSEGAWVAHPYTQDGTFAANPGFLDIELLIDDSPDGIEENEALGEDLDGDFGDGPEFLGEAERDMPFSFAMQMLLKDGDFEQVGEVLNCWIFGHMVEGDGGVDEVGNDTPFNPIQNADQHLHVTGGPFAGGDIHDTGTVVTFSEFMYPRMHLEDAGSDLVRAKFEDSEYIWDWWAPITASRIYTTFVDDPNTNEDDTYRTEYVLDAKVNRLRFDQTPIDSDGVDEFGVAISPDQNKVALPLAVGGTQAGFSNGSYVVYEYPWPRLSVASRVLDLFVCDGPARLGGDEVDDAGFAFGPQKTDLQWFSFYNANGFTGKSTPGMININTATVEAMRALPHFNKIVHATQNANVDVDDPTDFDISADVNPRTLLPESIVQWREKYDGAIDQITSSGYVGGPDYDSLNIDLALPNNSLLEETRGYASASEIGMLLSGSSIDQSSSIRVVSEPWSSTTHQAVRANDAWRIDYAGREPFSYSGSGNEFNIGSGYGTHISTDVIKPYYQEHNLKGDRVSGDAEELNLLLSGVSNLITTTSDVFTVHMRIRTFRRNPISNVWDATDLDYIIDDSRYVMLVDRSEVNNPQDKPKILYFEKLPN
ncbi:MAG: hypothetical protein QGI78_06630 [Phycisphaerales bacterium]|nr:hypothetical protein [Phycisphaerales bacterium]